MYTKMFQIHHHHRPSSTSLKKPNSSGHQTATNETMPTDIEDEISYERNPPLDEDDIALLKSYGLGPYSTSIKKVEMM
ncbi:hypothetical protein L2E82_32710 [Cichorium intybus]|uniref:Uncharacterized protein n=1 Tax=Cichorium intybus TaxID=13427 RepID=A0ACB9BHY0_CICIN|nr:hypothetical protein L2E82_32710 [Cichorium intybus]